jgi:2-keto-myo-inositol isomerase
MPGDGQIDLNAEIQILKQKGYDGTVSLELFNEEWWAKDPAETLRVGLERVSALVNE